MISIPIEIGDVILGGRFRNKKIEVKEIGTDEWGHPTVNGKQILKVRIQKLMKKEGHMNVKKFAKEILKTADAGSGKTLEAVDKLITQNDDFHVFFDGLIDYFQLKIYDEQDSSKETSSEFSNLKPNENNIALFTELKNLMKTAKDIAMKIE